MIKAMEIPYQTSLAESKYHGANSLKTLSDPVSFILNLMPGGAKWGGGGWPLPRGFSREYWGAKGVEATPESRRMPPCAHTSALANRSLLGPPGGNGEREML